MKQSLRSLALGLILSAFACWQYCLADAPFEQNQSPFLKGDVSAFGVVSEEVQLKLGFKCETTQEEDVVITEVRPQTPAFTAGIQKDDHIVDAQKDGDALNITIERNGQILKARLRETSQAVPQVGKLPPLVAQQAKMDNTPRKSFTLNAQQNAIRDNELFLERDPKLDRVPLRANTDTNRFALEANKNFKLLSDYNLELLVDRSMSMRKPDCPGGLSRWDWCGQQAEQLSRAIAPYAPNGLTIIPFATEYDVFEHATPQNIGQLFRGIRLQLGTRLFEPLSERLDNYFAHKTARTKPLLIVVVTDGVPMPRFEPAMVKKELIDTSQKMASPGDVTVIFCQIGGNDRFGQRFLTDMDQNLMSYGARYHFVHTISFDDLQDLGLGPALVSSIEKYAPTVTPKIAPPRPRQ